MFRGRFECSVDEKGRLQIPVGYRHQVTDEEDQFFITNSLYRHKKCLDLFLSSSWYSLEKRVARLPNFNRAVQDFQRFYLASAQSVKLDKQQRLLIPPGLRQFADLDNKVICVGMGEKIELWAKKTWLEVFESMGTHYENTLQDIAQLELSLFKEAL